MSNYQKSGYKQIQTRRKQICSGEVINLQRNNKIHGSPHSPASKHKNYVFGVNSNRMESQDKNPDPLFYNVNTQMKQISVQSQNSINTNQQFRLINKVEESRNEINRLKGYTKQLQEQIQRLRSQNIIALDAQKLSESRKKQEKQKQGSTFNIFNRVTSLFSNLTGSNSQNPKQCQKCKKIDKQMIQFQQQLKDSIAQFNGKLKTNDDELKYLKNSNKLLSQEIQNLRGQVLKYKNQAQAFENKHLQTKKALQVANSKHEKQLEFATNKMIDRQNLVKQLQQSIPFHLIFDTYLNNFENTFKIQLNITKSKSPQKNKSSQQKPADIQSDTVQILFFDKIFFGNYVNQQIEKYSKIKINEKLKQKDQSKNQELIKLKEDFKNQQKLLKQSYQQKLKSKQKQLDGLRQIQTKLEFENAQLKHKTNEIQERCQKSETQLKKAIEEKDKLFKNLNQNQQKFEITLTKLKDQNQKLLKNRQSKKSENSEQLNKVKQDLKLIQKQKQGLQQEEKSLRFLLQNNEVQLRDLYLKIQELEKTKEKNKLAIEDFRRKNENLRTELEKQIRSTQQLNFLIEKKDNTISSAQKQVDRVSKQNTQQKDKIQKLSSELQLLNIKLKQAITDNEFQKLQQNQSQQRTEDKSQMQKERLAQQNEFELVTFEGCRNQPQKDIQQMIEPDEQKNKHEAELRASKEEKQSLLKELEKKENDKIQLERKNNQLNEKLKIQKVKNESLRKEIEEKIKQLNIKNQETKILRKHFNDLQAKVAESIKLNQIYEKEIQKINQEEAIAKKNLHSRGQQLRECLKQFQTQKKRLKQSLEQSQKARITFEQQNKKYKLQIDALSKQQNRLSIQIFQMQEKGKKQQQCIQSKQTQITNFKAVIQKLTIQIKNLTSSNSTEQDKRFNIQNEQLQKFRTQIRDLKSKIKQLESQLKVNQEKLQEQAQQKKAFQQKYVKINTDFSIEEQKLTAQNKKLTEQSVLKIKEVSEKLNLEQIQNKKKSQLLKKLIKSIQLITQQLHTHLAFKIEQEDEEQSRYPIADHLLNQNRIDQKINQLKNIADQICIQIKKKPIQAASTNQTFSVVGKIPQKYLFASDILHEVPDDQTEELVKRIEGGTGKKILRSSLLYKHNQDKDLNLNPHSFVDERENVLLLVKLLNGSVLGGFSVKEYRTGIMNLKEWPWFGTLFSLTNKRYFYLKNEPKAKVLTYDQYYIIFGNSEIRMKNDKNECYTNFATGNAYFESENMKQDILLNEGAARETLFETYEIHQVFFTSKDKSSIQLPLQRTNGEMEQVNKLQVEINNLTMKNKRLQTKISELSNQNKGKSLVSSSLDNHRFEQQRGSGKELYFVGEVGKKNRQVLYFLVQTVQVNAKSAIKQATLVFRKSLGMKEIGYKIKQSFDKSENNKLQAVLILFTTKKFNQYGIYCQKKSNGQFQTVLINIGNRRTLRSAANSGAQGYLQTQGGAFITFGNNEIKLSNSCELTLNCDGMGRRYFEDLESWMGNVNKVQLEEIQVFKIEFEDKGLQAIQEIVEQKNTSTILEKSNLSKAVIAKSQRMEEKPAQPQRRCDTVEKPIQKKSQDMKSKQSSEVASQRDRKFRSMK